MAQETGLTFWDSVEKTDPSYTKSANVSGQHRTAVDAQYKKKMITKAFGMYGLGWGVLPESETFERVHYENSTCILTYRATAFYVYKGERGLLPIAASIMESYVTNKGQGYLKIDDEAIKKVRTDALTKGFTDLGFCADIHMGLFDDQNYVEGVKLAKQIENDDILEAARAEAVKAIHDYCAKEIESASKITNFAGYEKAMLRIQQKYTVRCKAAGMSPSQLDKRLYQLIEERKSQLDKRLHKLTEERKNA